MSYYCEIYFKQIDGDNIHDFLIEFKKCAIEKIPEIAKEAAYFSPLADEVIFKNGDILSDDLRKKTMTWGRNSVFSYRYFYNKELHLLGVYGAGEQFADLFDDVITFQNSTDQNYEYETWSKIESFKKIADKWMNMPHDAVRTIHLKNNKSDYDFDVEYWRKSYTYAEIWDLLSSTFENNDEMIYLKLFSDFDVGHMIDFYICIKNKLENEKRLKDRTKNI